MLILQPGVGGVGGCRNWEWCASEGRLGGKGEGDRLGMECDVLILQPGGGGGLGMECS